MRELFVKSARASLPQFPYTDTGSLALSPLSSCLAERAEEPRRHLQTLSRARCVVIIMILLESNYRCVIIIVSLYRHTDQISQH